MDEKVYSVDEVTEEIAGSLEGNPYLQGIHVVGEIADIKVRGNHLYFNLLGESSRLPCVFFGKAWMREELKEGEVVRVFGNVSVYRPKGFYSFRVEEIGKTGFFGGKFLDFARLLESLKREGVLERRKKPFPEFPYRIGVVTSLDSAALRDILRTLEDALYVELKIFHTQVHGEGAHLEIARALREASSSELDVLIIARGGGSSDDLWVFNDEDVVRAALESPHFLITGIGHAIDSVILDMIADRSVVTPTAAARLVVERQREYFENITSRLKEAGKGILEEIEMIGERSLKILKEIERSVSRYVEEREIALENLFSRIGDLSPISTLSRGYAVVMKDGKVLRGLEEIEEGDEIEVIMKGGKLRVVVHEVRRDPEKA